MALVFVAALLGLPFLMEFVRVGDILPENLPEVLLVPFLMVDRLVLSAVAVALGLLLGKKVGLDAPIVRGWAEGKPGTLDRFRRVLLPGLLWGFFAGIVLAALSPVSTML